MTKGIIVASFGTSYPETRKKSIESTENKIRENYPEYTVQRAFTSFRIIKKLKDRDKIFIDTPSEAIDKMIESGINEIHLQPLHIIPGFEYEKVKHAVVMANHREGIKATIGSPLLNREEHYDQVVDSLLKKLPEETEGQGFIFMGHGTEHFANACYSMLQNKINDLRDDILIANVEGYPEIDHVIDKVNAKYKKITLLPLMLVAGDHAINDMAGDEDSFKCKLEEKGIEVSCIIQGLGENEDIQNAFLSRVDEVLKK